MFTDPDIDVIYITTPHMPILIFMRRAIENGKHILVEKIYHLKQPGTG